MADPRVLSVTTPLGPDALYLTSVRGREGLSQLFDFQLEMMAENRTNVAFDKLIGQKVGFSLLMPDGKTKRHWAGICSALSQEGRDSTFTKYRMEVVPQLWLLTRRQQSRIFQYQTVPDILKAVLAGLDVKLELQGTFEPRDFCVQYRETDFEFASRIMEEEGIYYFFKHGEGTHQMILGNSPQTHLAVPFAEKAIYEELEGGNRPDMRVHSWTKSQELRSGKVTLWDHCFELPHVHLDAERPTQESVDLGKVPHKLKLPANDPLELYDYPGAYAQRFDGIDKGGGAQAGNLQKIFQDNKRTAAIRMEQEAVQGIVLRGSGNCRQFAAGHKFTLERHFNADGPYVLTSVEHSAVAGANMRSGASDAVQYQNQFTCIPLGLPYRPAQKTEKPFIPGPQTAVVVGPPGEKIFCDKYGRVKVQFHWDRAGKKDANSSCWLRVSQNWGGANWGGMFLPHVGHEVIVSFEEGDPDRPLITGRVYNAECMPPLELPANKTKSVIRDHGGNEIIMEGEAGKQQMRLFCPKHDTHVILGNSINMFTSSDWISKNLANTRFETQGQWLQKIMGDVVVNRGANLTDNILGWTAKSVIGFSTEFYGGLKYENILGAEVQSVRGIKAEKVKGAKVTKGDSPEFDNFPDAAKHVKGKIVESAANVYNTAKTAIKNKCTEYSIGAKMLLEDANNIKESAKSAIEEQASMIKMMAKTAWEVETAKAKLRLSLMLLNAGVDVNNGIFKILK